MIWESAGLRPTVTDGVPSGLGRWAQRSRIGRGHPFGTWVESVLLSGSSLSRGLDGACRLVYHNL